MTQKVCDECGSTYNAETSAMAALCPECAHWLYGYPSCEHVFADNATVRRCTRCAWDGSRSKYILTLIDRQSSALLRSVVPEPLPTFVYHPDPIATGSVAASEARCECCGQARGYKYTSTLWSDRDIEVICPWCIADGSAHEKFNATFTDRAGIGDYGTWGTVPDDVADEIAHRTPGFSGWQQHRWWICCGDGAVFVGPAGKPELAAYGDAAVDAVRQESGFEGDDWSSYFDALDRDYGPTAYVFRCRHCGKLGGYSDCD